MPASASTWGPRLGKRPEIIGGGVDDRGDAGVDEGLRGGPVHVEVVEDGDVAGTQPGQQDAGPPLDAGGAGEPGSGGRPVRVRVAGFMTGAILSAGRARSRQPPGRGASAARPGSAQRAGRLGGVEQLAGVGQGGVGLLHAGEHPGQLTLAGGRVEHGQARRW